MLLTASMSGTSAAGTVTRSLDSAAGPADRSMLPECSCPRFFPDEQSTTRSGPPARSRASGPGFCTSGQLAVAQGPSPHHAAPGCVLRPPPHAASRHVGLIDCGLTTLVRVVRPVSNCGRGRRQGKNARERRRMARRLRIRHAGRMSECPAARCRRRRRHQRFDCGLVAFQSRVRDSVLLGKEGLFLYFYVFMKKKK